MNFFSAIHKLLHNIDCETINFFNILKNSRNAVNINACVMIITENIKKLRYHIDALEKSSNSNIEIGDMVENELEEMDKSIKDAADKIINMLSASRKKDNGIKLEVNEKILDACTFLMECIMQLIRQSRYLQEEIIANGRGTFKMTQIKTS